MSYTENQQGTATAKKFTPESIIETIKDHKDPELIREDLLELMENFFMRHPGPTEDYKEQIYGSYKVLRTVLGQIKEVP